MENSAAQLTKDEQMALEMLKATGEIQRIARPDGTVTLADLHQYFQALTRRLEFSQKRRKNDYIDVDVVQQEVAV